jgi:hypothetical protein
MSSLNTLPIELLREILSIFRIYDISTLQECRLVQRQWKKICDEYFLPDVCFSRPQDLLRILAIAEDECIAGHVRSITFAEDIFREELQEQWTEDEQSNRQLPSVQENAHSGDGDTSLPRISRLLCLFKRLKKLTISKAQTLDTVQIMAMRQLPEDEAAVAFQLAAREHARQLAMRDNAVARQLVVLHAALSHASIHLDELCVERLNTTFFLSRAAEIGQNWKSLTVLRLGIVQDEELRGVEDLKTVLHELTNLRQLHLSGAGPHITPLDPLLNDWNQLIGLTLRQFVVGEPTLQALLNVPSLRSISLHNILLEDDGCWIRIMAGLQMKNWERVSLSGYLANMTADEGWGGDSNKDGDLLKEVAEWLMDDYGDEGNKRQCPLTTENMNL